MHMDDPEEIIKSLQIRIQELEGELVYERALNTVGESVKYKTLYTNKQEQLIRLCNKHEEEATALREKIESGKQKTALAKRIIDGEICTPWVRPGSDGENIDMEPHEVRLHAHLASCYLTEAIHTLELSE